MFKSSLNPKPKIQEIKEESKSPSENISEMSFDADDIELEDEMETTYQNYEQDFKNNKEKLCSLLDQVLFDLNCVNFFDKNHRNKINEYFEHF